MTSHSTVANLITSVKKSSTKPMHRSTFFSDTRAAYFPVSYALTLGITVLLLSGIMTGTGAFVDQKADNAANSELQVIGDRLATQIMAVDQQVQEDGDVEMVIHVDIPKKAAGSYYNVRIRNEPVGGTDKLQIWSVKQSAVVEIPINVSNAVSEGTVVSSDEFVITVQGGRITLGAEY